jgi:hypothetical protein
MLTSEDVTFFARLVNSLISRQPVLLATDDSRGTIQALRYALSFVPSHRYLLVAGDVPKWARHLDGQPREIPHAEPDELLAALESVIAEERSGRRAAQLIYFGAHQDTYERILKFLPLGWIATTNEPEPIIRSLPHNSGAYETPAWNGLKAFHLGSPAPRLDFETAFLGRLVGKRKGVVSFLVQKKFSEMFLAGLAIRRDLEEGSPNMTAVDLEELFELDEQAAAKMFELIWAEEGLDLTRYVVTPSPDVSERVRRLAETEHAVAIAAVHEDKVLAVRWMRSSQVAVSALARVMAGTYARLAGVRLLGRDYVLYCAAGREYSVVVGGADAVVYVLILSSEGKAALGVSSMSETLNLKIES